MAKITAEQLEIAKGWQKFGECLGWKMEDCRDVGEPSGHAKFIVAPENAAHRHTITIFKRARQDIEATWREQDKPEIKVVGNG